MIVLAWQTVFSRLDENVAQILSAKPSLYDCTPAAKGCQIKRLSKQNDCGKTVASQDEWQRK